MFIHDSGQLGFPNFLLPFEGQLDPQNPWLVLSRLIPWEEFEGALRLPVFQLSRGSGEEFSDGAWCAHRQGASGVQ